MQTTKNILMIRPSRFIFNSQTAASNSFQKKTNEDEGALTKKAKEEFDTFASMLKSKGVNVLIYDDTEFPEKPDAVFPNNWVSFHPDGTVILYPMHARNRRAERRKDILDSLDKAFYIHRIVDLSGHEQENRFLEGTGSIVFDHKNKIAYACISPRTDKDLFTHVCGILNYRPVIFYAHDKTHKEIYHTNVMLSIGTDFAVICSESISDKKERQLVLSTLMESGHQLVDISFEQMNQFAGNMLSVRASGNKDILVLSQTSYDILTTVQKNNLEKYVELVPVFISAIETTGGGSARCMMAEVFLQPLKKSGV
jgi:hypothetical protein